MSEQIQKDAIIDLKNISVVFHKDEAAIKAVDKVDLQIDRGDIYGIIGYSGAGKSTLVRVINLLQRPTSGQVIVNNESLLDLPAKQLRASRKKIGMIFQHFNLMDSRTVFNNVEYPLLHEKISKVDRQKRVSELLETVGLSTYAKSYPDQLSGGQKQRVAIARALASNPDVLISDEATSALDPKTTDSILKLLKRLKQELNLTIVLITHEMNVIKTICHNVAVIENGSIIEQGPVSKVFTQPKKKLTADFVDTSTNIRSALVRIKNDVQVRNLSGGQKLVQLNFIGNSSKQSLISELARDYHVDANILFANVDQIDGVSVGYMIAVLTGPDEAIEESISVLQQNGVKTSIIDLTKITEEEA
ncbi:methionine ABC transporter ATP-binding protein [Pediococcus claussenii]|uniref:D-methionine ABC transporter, ATP-binding protein n=1 Tax=Pediococcus claussenii (strain ATCC BAA-344 / DSM 14800 / JCM 18046 / KCTC 3811 / LMG 21948 / P06) TaxID=701521 RepID=G8PAF7_PEDCP|nr:methionine ABC transporter ATP-binding protein [Pediococcus claussenii]AEV95746.1 D-methionine ABC transporter, ATP-binding protein [Pediococcus claussenii ATCC BAA-344]ANZ69255.1 phosphate ABC transporter ATP-binding protein [Pediococcus claussenii]ANZ71074.1 phosphate ABC transporter ATP-binding protein [Pediococcus claussenii]KRN20356.1 hypothetical protein IV79_GL000409 [Pediococcus claussenii]